MQLNVLRRWLQLKVRRRWVQLNVPRRPSRREGACFALLVLSAVAAASGVSADGVLSTTNTLFLEYGGPLRMTVFTPGVSGRIDLGDHVAFSAGWDADIVSGASVAVVDAPASSIDAISTASVTDLRNVGKARLEFRDETTSLRLGYQYGTESDYRSHSFDVSARTELFERNTAFEITYARGFDTVCDLAQDRAQNPVDRQRLPTSDGCYGTAMDRVSRDVSLQTFQGSWSQAWAPVFSTQLSFTAQLVDGFQSNPYRAVWLGRSSAQEHHPDFRARYAIGLGSRLWLKPLKAAVQLDLRAYRDTWDVASITGELAWDQTIGGGLRLRVRGRYYKQTSATFFSDDYSRNPRGEFFTGDRELSAMSSVTVGGRIAWDVPANEEGEVLGFMSSFSLIGKFDYMIYDFTDFSYGAFGVPNNQALVATASIEAGF